MKEGGSKIMCKIPASLPEEPFLSACIAEADEALILPVLEALQALGVRVCYEKTAMELLIKSSRACLFFLTSEAVRDLNFRRKFTQNLEMRMLAAVIRQPVLPPVVEAQLFQCTHQFFPRLSPEQLCKWLKKIPEAAACIQTPAAAYDADETQDRTEWELCCLRTGQQMRMPWDRTILIGRKKDECQFVVSDSAGISRKHAVLRPTETGWTVRDLHARNGTYVNGMLLEPGTETVLKAGDHFSLGKEAFAVRIVKEK